MDDEVERLRRVVAQHEKTIRHFECVICDQAIELRELRAGNRGAGAELAAGGLAEDFVDAGERPSTVSATSGGVA